VPGRRVMGADGQSPPHRTTKSRFMETYCNHSAGDPAAADTMAARADRSPLIPDTLLLAPSVCQQICSGET